MCEKEALRQEVKQLKKLLFEDEKVCKSASIWRQVEATEYFVRSRVILLYWSMPDEVQTHDFIQRWHMQKTIILPVIDGDNLRLKPFMGRQYLQHHSTLNLYEPQGDDYANPDNIDIAIVPGIAFDSHNHRLGRGKGYYDKLLSQLNVYKIGVAFDFQMFNNIPFDEHDIAMDEVIIG